jgi:hypothetical protein
MEVEISAVTAWRSADGFTLPVGDDIRYNHWSLKNATIFHRAISWDGG